MGPPRAECHCPVHSKVLRLPADACCLPHPPSCRTRLLLPQLGCSHPSSFFTSSSRRSAASAAAFLAVLLLLWKSEVMGCSSTAARAELVRPLCVHCKDLQTANLARAQCTMMHTRMPRWGPRHHGIVPSQEVNTDWM